MRGRVNMLTIVNIVRVSQWFENNIARDTDLWSESPTPGLGSKSYRLDHCPHCQHTPTVRQKLIKHSKSMFYKIILNIRAFRSNEWSPDWCWGCREWHHHWQWPHTQTPDLADLVSLLQVHYHPLGDSHLSSVKPLYKSMKAHYTVRLMYSYLD